MKTEIFLQKVLVVRKKVVPLHPLTRGRPLEALRKSSLIDLHRQNEVVQEAGAFLCFWVMNEPLIILTGAFCLILFRSCPGHRFRQLLRPAFFVRGDRLRYIILQWRV